MVTHQGKPRDCVGRSDPTSRFPIQENELYEPLEEWTEEGLGACKEAFSMNGEPAGTALDEGWISIDIKEAIDPSTPLSIHILAHCKQAQELFDTIPLSWGVQYEIARGVLQGAWTWETVVQARSALRTLRGPNTNASRVSQVLGCPLGDTPPSDDAVWSELDREDAAIAEARGRGLGLQGDFMGQQDWYGGKVQQAVMLQEDGDRGFRFVLTKMEMGKSNRFARFLGSRRVLQVSIPYYVVNGRADELRAFFAQKFVLCGRVFVAFCVKGTRVFMMEIPEDYERAAVAPGDLQRITLMDFIAWHSPIDRNGSQLISEWVSSFDLGLSSSVPVLSIPPKDVDPVAPLDDPHKHIYTDGCGWMNNAALSAIARHIGLEERPTAVQGRFGGAKGLWVLHPHDQSSMPRIWVSKSQVKTKLDTQNPHPAHSIFELLGVSRVTPSRLSRPVILNLSHNGVPKETFVELMKEMIDEEVKPLMQWSGPKAMFLLWKVVERLKAGRGWMKYEPDDQSPGSTAQPRRTIHNVVLDLLQAGFHPLKLEYLFESLKKVVKLSMDNIVCDFRLSVHRCVRASIVPDPYGVLREGEIYFKSTKPFNLTCVDNLNPYLLLGDVLIYRDPCVLPSDVRKVKAVECKALSAYTDVVVVPTRSFASYLGGGDYDGDAAVVIYDDRVVKDFHQPPLTSEPCDFMYDNFEEIGAMQQATVSDLAVVLDRPLPNSDAYSHKFQESFLLRLRCTAPIGLYRRFCDGSAYEYGYDAPETIRLALMFRRLLDSQKAGRHVKEEVFQRDKLQFSKELPPSLQSWRGGAPQRRGQESDNPCFKRDQNKLGEFILDYLFNEGQKRWNDQIKHFDRLKPRSKFNSDEDLLQPWKRLNDLHHDSSSVRAALTIIQEHVDAHIKKWQDIARRTSSRSFTRTTAKSGASKSEAVQVQYNELARSYAACPVIPTDCELASFADIEQLMASYAYTTKPGFAWKVACQALCHIKAAAQRTSCPSLPTPIAFWSRVGSHLPRGDV